MIGIVLIVSLVCFAELHAMEDNAEPLKKLIAAKIIINEGLLEQVIRLPNQDIQNIVTQKLIDSRIKPALYPIKFKQPMNPKSVNHNGVCGLETISRSSQIISIGCDGQIAICDEQAMHNCEVVNTQTNWYCATMQCEPPTLCLGDLSGNIGYMGLKDKEPERVFKAHEQAINGLSLSPDQTQLISCSNDGQVKLWEADINKVLATFKGHTKAVKNAFSILAHQKVVSGAADQTVRIWDIENQKEEQRYSLQGTLFQNDSIFRLAHHPHEQTAVAGINNGIVAIWDIRKNRFVDCLRGHNTVISALLCSEDGNYIASASWDGKVRLWDLRMMACSAILAYHKDWIQSVSSLHNFARIVSGSRDGQVKVWDVSTVLAVDKMNDLKKVAAQAKLIAAEIPISNEERLEMLNRITERSQP